MTAYEQYLATYNGRTKNMMSYEEFVINEFLKDNLDNIDVEINVELDDDFPTKNTNRAERRASNRNHEAARLNELLNSKVASTINFKEGRCAPATELFSEREINRYKKGNNQEIRSILHSAKNWERNDKQYDSHSAQRAREAQKLVKELNRISEELIEYLE